ncbi:hypothetical protein B0H14DRAFT_2615699 [Mycena olivaceomarginata]|nr:hypothetical protein B0H14DRAFT_2615699 [Mycena olivaceomarginata]
MPMLKVARFLGLENAYNMVRDQVAANSKAVSKTWTTLLRFQVLDVLLATRWGNVGCSMRGGTGSDRVKQTEYERIASGFVDEFQTSYQNEVRKIEKEAKRKARTSKGKAGAQNDALDGMSAPSPSVEFEAWSLVQKLSGMTTRSLFQKTTKNLQSIGTALTWIIEVSFSKSHASADDLCPLTIRVNDLYNVTPSVATQVGTLAIIDLLRPLSYALNSSFLAVFCDLDLQKKFGNVMHQYETKMFLGRYRPPRLAYMEELVFAAVRDIAIGTPVDVSIAKFFSPDSEYLKNLPPSDPADLSIFVPADNIRLPATSIRKRAKPVPLQLDVPQLPCSRVIATALASTIRHSPESSSVSQPDWSSLLALEEETDRGEAEGTGATDGAALEKQVVPSGAEHGLTATT